jgi:hypothetical protein
MKRIIARTAATTAALMFTGIVLAQPAGAPAKRYPWDQRPGKCFADSKLFPDIALSPMCKSRNWVDFERSKRDFVSLLAQGDYDLIELAESELGFSRQKFATGEYLFEPLYLALYESLEFSTSPKLVDQWSRAKGEEGYAKLARALLLYHQAWRARGSGYASTVTPEGWKIFHSKLSEANATLDSASAKLKQTGPWHALKVRVIFMHPELKDQRLKVIQAATSAWPDYLLLYTVPMGLMHPRWGGSYELMEGAARMALEKTRGEHGASVYALAYERLFRADCDCTLADSKVDWPAMKQGIRDLQARREVSPERLKHFAAMACQMRDRDEARHLYTLYDKALGAAVSGEPDACRTFASR